MPAHLSEDGKTVLDPSGKPVPGGKHETHAQALAHMQAMNINLRREEGKPVAPKQKADLSQAQRDKLPDSDFVDPQGKRFPIKDASDVMDAVQSYGRANPKIPYEHFKQRLTEIARRKGFESSLPQEWKNEKASWLVDPTDEDVYQFLVNEDMDEYLPRYFKQQNYDPGNGIDRTNYHPVDERFMYQTAPDWNDDTAIAAPEIKKYIKPDGALIDTWVLAHPYGDSKNQDAHEEHFDQTTNFYEKEKLLDQIPVSYYHNYKPDGTPSGQPIAIGKTIARKYLPIGRADKIQFDKNIPPEIKSRLAKAMSNGTLRASPTVVPDFHKVNDQTGHIDNWLTGSIAVFDAEGDRQPANARAIGIPAMKALFKQAHLQFPKHLEVKMGKQLKAAPTWKARFLKAVIKALGEVDVQDGTHTHPDGSQHANHEGSEKPHEHDEQGAMKALETEGQNLVDDASQRARFEGADTENVEKDVQPLAQLEQAFEEMEHANESGNALKEPDVQLDWKPEQKRMKAIVAAQANQLKALQAKADNGDFNSWVSEQLISGKVLPAEVEDRRIDYLQALADDRTSHPVMKARDGKVISRVERFKKSIEERKGRFEEMDLTAEQMKALGLQFNQVPYEMKSENKPMTPERRDQLLAASAMGEKILQDKNKK